jgi:ribosomal protein S18 acetylase RimI-like enzyme
MPVNAPPRNAIALRPCTGADVPFLRQLYGSTRQAELGPVPWTFEQKRWFIEQQFSAQQAHYEAHYPGCAFLIIELEGRPAGRLYVHRGDEDIRIVDITIVPGARGRGIGGLLVAELIAEGRATSRTVSIHVEQDNPAMRLYHRLGFRRVDTYGIYHLMEWRAAPAAAAAGKGLVWTSPR